MSAAQKNPYTATGRPGSFGGWDAPPEFGQIEMADAIVTCSYQSCPRWLLLVERQDSHGWAVPGGHIDPCDHSALEAALRELYEETGLVLSRGGGRVMLTRDHEVAVTGLETRHVPDPRETDDAWAVTTPVVFDLGHLEALPAVAGADDAKSAVWVPARSFAELEENLASVSGAVFAAHVDMLKEMLG